ISLNTAQYALPVFAIAFAVYFRTKKHNLRNIAQAFMGLSLLFFGMHMINESGQHFATHPLLTDFFKSMRQQWTYSLIFSMVFCAIVQSSAVTVALAMTLASSGAITLYDAALWVYGANIGTTSVALIAATNSNYVGKQVAWAHFFYKFVSVLIFFPITDFFVNSLHSMSQVASRTVANAHLFFNVASAVLFFPFIKKGADLIEKLIPRNTDQEFGTKFLSLENYQNSSLALSYAQREIMRMADIVLSMVDDSIKLFDSSDGSLIEVIKEKDNRVDFLYRETKMFLLDNVNKGNMGVHQDVMDMIMFISDLERAADSIDINIIALAIKKSALKLEFSEEGWQEIRTMHQQVCRVASMAINSFTNRQMREDAIELKRNLAKLEITLRENHISRLNRGVNTSINTSSIHLDLLSEYRRIGSLLCNHAYSKKEA
ncbi:MAG TPA: Na/Pi cotransporter family protein, partial [Pseudobdellovibrionaceae bacterium]|nr:Na/Pi cotransporter family protein [Pseudobdellovibrionaceae bacterium]